MRNPKDVLSGHTHSMAIGLGFIDRGELDVDPLPISDTCPDHILEQEKRLNVPPHQFQERLPNICRAEWKYGSIIPDRDLDISNTLGNPDKGEPGTEFARWIPPEQRHTALVMFNILNKNWIPYQYRQAYPMLIPEDYIADLLAASKEEVPQMAEIPEEQLTVEELSNQHFQTQ